MNLLLLAALKVFCCCFFKQNNFALKDSPQYNPIQRALETVGNVAHSSSKFGGFCGEKLGEIIPAPSFSPKLSLNGS